MSVTKIKFELFRYQLLTSDQKTVQFFSDMKPAEDVREKKNEYFFEALSSINEWKDPVKKLEIISETIYSDDDLYVCKIGARKTLKYTDENFQENTTDDWPHVTVVVNNKPNVQIIAVSPNNKAFSSSNRVVDVMMKTLQDILKSYGLVVYADPLFDKKRFWEIVEKHKGKIYSVKFEMISPNISNIRKTLYKQVLLARDECNAKKTLVELEADKGAALTLNEDNEYISGMVDYSSEGGGEIKIRARGERVITTKKQPRSVTVSVRDEDTQGDFFKETATKLFDKLKKIIK